MHKNASSSYGLWPRLSENCVLIPVVAIFKNNLCSCTYDLVLFKLADVSKARAD
jgi:hypothetical protein